MTGRLFLILGTPFIFVVFMIAGLSVHVFVMLRKFTNMFKEAWNME